MKHWSLAAIAGALLSLGGCVDPNEASSPETTAEFLLGKDLQFYPFPTFPTCTVEGANRRIYYKYAATSGNSGLYQVYADWSSTYNIPSTQTFNNNFAANTVWFISVSNCKRDLGCWVQVTLDYNSNLAEDDESNNYADVLCPCQTACSDGI